MSSKMMLEVMRHSRTKGNAKLVLLAITSYAHPDGTHCEASLATLAKETGISRRQVTTLVHALAAEGHITLLSGAADRRSNRYAVLRPWLGKGNVFPGEEVALEQSLPYSNVFPREEVALEQSLPTNLESKEREKQSGAMVSTGQKSLEKSLPQSGRPLHPPALLTPQAERWARANHQPHGIASQACGLETQETAGAGARPPAPLRPPRKFPFDAKRFTLGDPCQDDPTHRYGDTGQSLRLRKDETCYGCFLAAKKAAWAQRAAHRQAQGG